MRKILLACLLACVLATGAKAQSNIVIQNQTHCDVWVSVIYQDITGCQYFSDVFLVAAGTTPTYYYYSGIFTWIPPGCTPPDQPVDLGYFFSATVYDANPDPTICPTAANVTVGSCWPLTTPGSISPLSSCSTCGLNAIKCNLNNPCPPAIPPLPQTSVLTIN